MTGRRIIVFMVTCGVLGGVWQAWSFVHKHSDAVSFRFGKLAGRKPVEPQLGIISIGDNSRLGGEYILALRGEGDLWGWGTNAAKELGLASIRSLPVPKPLMADRIWHSVSAGNVAVYAISPGGHLWHRGFIRDSWKRDEAFSQQVDLQPLFTNKLWRKVLQSGERTVGLDENGHLWNWEESVLEDGEIVIDHKVEGREVQVRVNLGDDGLPRHETDEELNQQTASRTSESGLQQLKDSWTQQYMPNNPGFLDSPEGRQVLANIERAAAEQQAQAIQGQDAWKKAKTAMRALQFPAEITPQRQWVDFCVDVVVGGLGKPGRIYAVDSEGGLWKSGDAKEDPEILGHIPHFTLTRVPVTPRLKRVFCRENATRLMALDDQHQLWGWGLNDFGELGSEKEDTVYGHTKPVPEEGFRQLTDKHWIELALGHTFTFGIDTEGRLWAWGRNLDSELGIDDGKSHHTLPALVDDKHQWIAVTAGGVGGAAITSQGELYTWGKNLLGEGGIVSDRKTPGLTQEHGGWGIGLASAGK